MRAKKCAQCGGDRGSKLKYCSKSCKDESNRKFVDKKCLKCGVVFRPTSKNGKYCTRGCYIDNALCKVGKKCAACGSLFTSRSLSAKFCSIKCRELGRTRRPAKNCKVCGKPFSKRTKTLVCSMSCSRLMRRKPDLIRRCDACNKNFKVPRYNRDVRFCSNVCVGKARRLPDTVLFFGRVFLVSELATIRGCRPSWIHSRLKRMSPEEAVLGRIRVRGGRYDKSEIA